MRKAKTLLGLNVISQVEGKNLGTVRDLIFDESARGLLALLLTDRELFGLLDAQVIPFSQVREIGPHAVMVPNADASMKAHADPVIARAFDAKTVISGKKITTQGGEYLGTIADVFVDNSGQVTGFEISGGLLADAFNGKRYIDAPSDLTVGADVVLVPHDVATVLLKQHHERPGGINAVAKDASNSTAGLGQKVGQLYQNASASLEKGLESAKASLTSSYENVANASVEKQREFVIGKVASRDVILPVPTAATDPETTALQPADAVDITSSGEVVEGEILVRKGEIITAEHADRAIASGILAQLLLAAAGTVASSTFSSGRDAAANVGTSARGTLEQSAIGKPAGKEVLASDGSVLVAPGMIITAEVLDLADLQGKKGEVIAAAGFGTASQSIQNAQEGVSNIWNQIKEKKAQFDARGQDKKINAALGRPVTRVILDRQDNIILNTGELVTNAAVERAREAGVLDILLDSVAQVEPEIAPSMLRANDRGQAALSSQPEGEFKPSPTYEVTEDETSEEKKEEAVPAGAQMS